MKPHYQVNISISEEIRDDFLRLKELKVKPIDIFKAGIAYFQSEKFITKEVSK